MSRKRSLALGAAVLATVAALATGVAAASGSSVTVRVEGLTHTLLLPKAVKPGSGWITKLGAPTGKCPASSAAGALDLATHHNWGGKWDSSFNDYEVLSILGEQHPFTSKYFWEVLVNNLIANSGVCGTKLHAGDRLVFAAVPDTPTEYPIAIEAPSSATVGHAFRATVVWFNAKGKPKPLAGATVSVAGRSGKTNSHGTLSLTASHAGTFVLTAQHAGYIRAAPVTVKVS